MDWCVLGIRVREFGASLRHPLRDDEHPYIAKVYTTFVDLVLNEPCSDSTVSDPDRDMAIFSLISGLQRIVSSIDSTTFWTSHGAASLYLQSLRAMDRMIIRDVVAPQADWSARKLSLFALWIRAISLASAPVSLAALDVLLHRSIRAIIVARSSHASYSSASASSTPADEAHPHHTCAHSSCAFCTEAAVTDVMRILRRVASMAATTAFAPSATPAAQAAPPTAGLLQKLAWLQRQPDALLSSEARHLIPAIAMRLLSDQSPNNLVFPITFRDALIPSPDLVYIAESAWTCLVACEVHLRLPAGAGGMVVDSAACLGCVMHIKVLASCCVAIRQTGMRFSQDIRERPRMRRRAVVRLIASVACSASKAVPPPPVVNHAWSVIATALLGVRMLVRPGDPFSDVLALLPHVRLVNARAVPRQQFAVLFMNTALREIVDIVTGRPGCNNAILDAYFDTAAQTHPGDLLHDIDAAYVRACACAQQHPTLRPLESSVFVQCAASALAGTDDEPTRQLHWCHFGGCTNLAGPSEFAVKTLRCGGASHPAMPSCSARYCGRACQVRGRAP
jgi:hypothetical protein